MTFKKNFLVLVSSIFLVLVGAYLVKLPRDILIYGMTITVAVSSASLMIEDFWRKMFKERSKLTWQYYLGMGVVFLAILAWLWTVESVTMQEFWLRLGVVVFSGGLGAIWFHFPYANSIRTPDQDEGRRAERAEANRWKKASKKLAKKKPEEKAKILSAALRYRLAGDRLGGELVFDKPIAYYEGKVLTLKEARKITPKDDSDPIIEITDRAARYVQALLVAEEE